MEGVGPAEAGGKKVSGLCLTDSWESGGLTAVGHDGETWGKTKGEESTPKIRKMPGFGFICSTSASSLGHETLGVASASGFKSSRWVIQCLFNCQPPSLCSRDISKCGRRSGARLFAGCDWVAPRPFTRKNPRWWRFCSSRVRRTTSHR